MIALAKRYGAFAAVFAPIWLVLLYQGFNPGFSLLQGMRPVLTGAAALTGLLVLAAAVAIVRRNDAIYDWLAGTRVVRLNLVEAGHAWSELTRQVTLRIGGPGHFRTVGRRRTCGTPPACRRRERTSRSLPNRRPSDRIRGPFQGGAPIRSSPPRSSPRSGMLVASLEDQPVGSNQWRGRRPIPLWRSAAHPPACHLRERCRAGIRAWKRRAHLVFARRPQLDDELSDGHIRA